MTWSKSSSQAHPSGQKAKEVWMWRRRARRIRRSMLLVVQSLVAIFIISPICSAQNYITSIVISVLVRITSLSSTVELLSAPRSAANWARAEPDTEQGEPQRTGPETEPDRAGPAGTAAMQGITNVRAGTVFQSLFLVYNFASNIFWEVILLLLFTACYQCKVLQWSQWQTWERSCSTHPSNI